MKPNVLVIDDEKSSLDLMIFVLNAMGLTVVPALNGPAGLSMARALRPDLILCDVQMPHLDGIAIVNALREDPDISTVPVIAVTALAMPGDARRLLEAGFDGYVSKPVDFDSLRAELQKRLPSIGDDSAPSAQADR
jgi:two-component system cell cycle response regulator